MVSNIREDLFLSQVERVGFEIHGRFVRAHQVLCDREAALVLELHQLVINYKGEGLSEQIAELSLLTEQSTSTLQRNENKEILDLNLNIFETRIKELKTKLAIARRSCRIEFEWESTLDENLGTVGTIVVYGIPDYKKMDKPIITAGIHSEVPTSTPEEFRLPNSIAIDPESKNIFICDGGNSRVQVFTNSLKFLFAFRYKMRVPFGICIHCSKVYVTQLATNYLNVYSTNGEFIQSVGGKGKEELEFDQPRGIAISSVDNLIYICEKKNNRIQCLDLKLTFVAYISDIFKPLDVKLTSEDIIVLKRGNPSILFYNYSHQLVNCSSINQLRRPSSFYLDVESNILLTDYSADCVAVFSKKGEQLLRLGERGEGKGQFLEPVGIALDSANRIIVVSRNPTNCIQIF